MWRFLKFSGSFFFQPQNLGGGESDGQPDAEFVDVFLGPAQFIGEFFRLPNRGRIIPELRRTDGTPFPVERDKTMLLTGHTQTNNIF